MHLLISTNHKQISFLYTLVSLVGSLVGFGLSFLMRMELSTPGNHILVGDYQLWNILITAHGLIMVFFFVMPMGFGTLANFLLPLLLGVVDLAFPRLNNLSFWLMPVAFSFLLLASITEEGPGLGWTAYPPLSSIPYHAGPCVELAIFSLHVAGLASILASINFMVTAFLFRYPSLTAPILPLFVWATVVTGFLLVTTLPVLAAAITMLLLDRNLNTCFFDVASGGDPVIFQHLFWVFGHPEVYIIIIPVFGIVSSMAASLSGRSIFGYSGMVAAIVGIAFIGFIVWAHHMFTIGMDIDSRAYFSAATMVIAVPTAIKIFSWAATLISSSIPMRALYLWVVGFLVMFVLGGLTGLTLSSAAIDVLMHDTYFVVAHFHYVLSLAAVYGLIAASYYLVWRAFGVPYSEYWMTVHFWTTFISTNLIFMPMHWLGLAGMPRRIPDYPDVYGDLNQVVSSGSMLSLVSVFVWAYVVYNAYSSSYRGQVWAGSIGAGSYHILGQRTY